MFTFGVSPFFSVSAAACAAAGGLLLGITVMFKTGVVGRVLGISTYSKRLFVDPVMDRYAMVLGLVVAGALMKAFYGGIEPMPPTVLTPGEKRQLFVRFGVGGFILGAGSTLQNGCTSGHGLTGLARLSLRSWVAVPTFMAAGISVATLSGSARIFPADASTVAHTPAWSTAAWLIACVVAVLALVAGTIAVVVKKLANPPATRAAEVVAEYVVGLSFGCGLVISGMARPSKVAAFLDFGSGTWDPSLGLVMGGALLVTFPFFQILQRKGAENPLVGGQLDLPPSGSLDYSLVGGSVLFGAGWATTGMCPGPIWVAAGAMPSLEVLTVLLAMQAGTAVVVVSKRYIEESKSRSIALSPRDESKYLAVAGTDQEKGKA